MLQCSPPIFKNKFCQNKKKNTTTLKQCDDYIIIEKRRFRRHFFKCSHHEKKERVKKCKKKIALQSIEDTVKYYQQPFIKTKQPFEEYTLSKQKKDNESKMKSHQLLKIHWDY